MFCFRARKLILPYTEGALDVKRSAAVERHIAGCRRCSEELAMVTHAGAAIRSARTPAQEPAADLWARIERELAPVSAPATRPAFAPVRFRGLYAAGAAAAAAALVLLVVVTDQNPVPVGAPKQSTPVTTQVAPPVAAPLPDAPPTVRTPVHSPTSIGAVVQPPMRPHHVHYTRRPVQPEPTATVTRPAPEPVGPVVASTTPAAEEHGTMFWKDNTLMASVPRGPVAKLDSFAFSTGGRGKPAGSVYEVASAAPVSAAPSPALGAPAVVAAAVPHPTVTASAIADVDSASSSTTVDLLNSNDDEAKVSALFSYP